MMALSKKMEELGKLVRAYEKVEMRLSGVAGSQENLDEEDSKRLFLQSVLSEKIQLLLLYHREELLGSSRSLTFGRTTFGFRPLPLQVIKRPGRTWQETLEEIKQRKLPFLRNENQVDEERILLMRTSAEWMKDLRSVGLDIVQEESFFIETEEVEKEIQSKDQSIRATWTITK